MAADVAVVLSGCGYMDGAEVHEAVLSLFFLEREGATVHCFAPNKDQMHVVNHLTGDATGETRNVLTESARIARGQVKDIKEAKMDAFAALVIPGGFGVAKNLSTFATEGPSATVDPDLARLVAEAAAAKKPIVAICIAPAVVAAALKLVGKSATLTIGSDEGTAAAIATLGSKHENCPVQEAVVDEVNRIISTPAYMLGPGPKDVGAGIEQAIKTVMRWVGK